MACACIDIGSNTTRLLVAERTDGVLREVLAQRAFTRIGKSIGDTKEIPAEKVAEDIEVARYYPEDDRFLLARPAHVEHHRVVRRQP